MHDMGMYEKIIIYDKKFPVKMTMGSAKSAENGEMIFANHWHDYIELWYLKTGEATIKHGKRQSLMKAGDIAIANSRELHEGYYKSEQLEYFCVLIDQEFFLTDFFERHVTFENIISGDEIIKKCMEKMFNEYKAHKTGYDLAIKGELYEMLSHLVRYYTHSTITQEEYVERRNKLERIMPAIKYIEQNYNTEISYGELAKLINVSKYHFLHLFKEATGKTVVGYINDIRIDEAYNLLKNTAMSITQVSMSVGFSDVNYFSRIFKKKKNIAPSKVRG